MIQHKPGEITVTSAIAVLNLHSTITTTTTKTDLLRTYNSVFFLFKYFQFTISCHVFASIFTNFRFDNFTTPLFND